MPTHGTHELHIGDNLDVMKKLEHPHAGTVNCIYIDPPYNTGNKYFLYDDSFTIESSWLDFMKPRLELSHNFLKDNGVIIVSINDKHFLELKMLLNNIYGEKNFVANIVWQGTPSSLSKYTSGGTDYLLIYAKNIKFLDKFREPKLGAIELVEYINGLKNQQVDSGEAQKLLREYLKKNNKNVDNSLQFYNRVDSSYRIFTTTTLDNNLYRPNLIYPVVNPLTGEETTPPPKGWKVSKETMDALIKDDLIAFDGGKYPRKKILLENQMFQLPGSVFYAPRQNGSAVLKKVIGPNSFPFPKNVEVLERWFSIVTQNNPTAVFMDFFAGSGSTTHAVINLNKKDNGSRNSIIITNNENNIPDTVTIPRVQNVISGKWFDTNHSECTDVFSYEYSNS